MQIPCASPRLTAWIGLAAACLAASGCVLLGAWEDSEEAIYQPSQLSRVEYLEREVERLRADLREAEETLIWIESGLRGVPTRADAVSSVAEARIALDRARSRAPWRQAECDAVQGKLEEAERQMREGNMGTAIFFASRARRMAEGILGEGRRAEDAGKALHVRGRGVKLRAGPSTDDPVLAVLADATPVVEERREGDWVLVRTHAGRLGWIYASLLRSR